jgi:hypothetical protein
MRPEHESALRFALRRPLLVAAAFVRLAEARWLHARRPASELLANLNRPSRGLTTLSHGERRDLSRAIAAVARRVPWRADCLVQALAARRWLEARDAPSELRLGAWRDGAAVTAHAWLLSDGEVVTGGALDPKIAPFAPAAQTEGAAPRG